MAKMSDFFVNISTTGDDGGEWMAVDEPKAGADLSQIAADLANLPKTEPPSHKELVAMDMPPLNSLSYNAYKKFASQMYGVPGKLIEQPSPEVMALRKVMEVLEQKISEMQYGQSQTIVAPIHTPVSYVAFDPIVPPKLTIKTLTVTIRLED